MRRRRVTSSRPLHALCYPAACSMAACMLAAGCATLPAGGQVRSVNVAQGGAGQGQNFLQPIPTSPGRGWTPRQIVSGFLAADASFVDDHAVARRYLLPTTSTSWHPGWSVVVFGQDLAVDPLVVPPRVTSGGQREATVVVSGRVLGNLSDNGQYVVAADGRQRVQERFVLVRHDGQWRIANLPDHLLLSQADFGRVYQPRNLYFFDPTMRVLVPDPVYVPEAATPTDLVTGLVRALATGPIGWLSQATRTAFPTGTSQVRNVVVDGNTAIVDLGGAAAQATDAGLSRVSAQLLWTLAGSSADQPAIQSVELEVDGTPWVPPTSSGSPVQQVDAYRGDVPAAPASASFYYVDDKGAVEAMSAASTPGGATPTGRPVPGSAGTPATPLGRVAVSPDGRYVAGLSPDGSEVYTGALRSGAALARRMSGGPFTSLSWDGHDELWVAGSGGVWVLPDAGGGAAAAYRPAARSRVVAATVAPDGVRCALVVAGNSGSRLVLGAITRSGSGARIVATVPIRSTTADIGDATWYGDNHLIVAEHTAAGTVLQEVPVNGGTAYTFPAHQGVESITADGPANPIVAGLTDGQLVTLASPGGLWSAATGAGRNPVYPG